MVMYLLKPRPLVPEASAVSFRLNISIQDAKRGKGIDFESLERAEGVTVLVVLNSDLLSHIEKNAMFERILLEVLHV